MLGGLPLSHTAIPEPKQDVPCGPSPDAICPRSGRVLRVHRCVGRHPDRNPLGAVMNDLIDLTGQTFGLLRVVRRADNTSQGSAAWVCRCSSCGDERHVKGSYLRNGAISGCNCLHIRHGHAPGHRGTPTYMSWIAMRQRCLNANARGFEHYGGRNISICERWSDFRNFLADMGERPPGLTLDRKENEQGYTKENCRWATQSQQQSNKRKLPNLSRLTFSVRCCTPEVQAKIRATKFANGTHARSASCRAKISATKRAKAALSGGYVLSDKHLAALREGYRRWAAKRAEAALREYLQTTERVR
jgi:hypothetical protein